MDNFQAIGQLVIKAQDLLDSIKGGAIRVMQEQFDALKVQFTDKLNSVGSELTVFKNQQQSNVNSIFTDPDKRYQTQLVNDENVTRFDLAHLDQNKFYCIAFHHAEMLDVRVRRYVADAGAAVGVLDYYVQLQNWSGGGDFNFIKQFHHFFNGGNQFVGKIQSTVSPYYSGIWLRGGWSYSVYCSGKKDGEIILVESDSQILERVNNIDCYAPTITEIHNSVVPNNFIAGQ